MRTSCRIRCSTTQDIKIFPAKSPKSRDIDSARCVNREVAHSIDGNIVLGFRCPERKSVGCAEVSRERVECGPVVVRRENGMIFQRESFHSQSCCPNQGVAQDKSDAGKCARESASPRVRCKVPNFKRRKPGAGPIYRSRPAMHPRICPG